jgi:hypothetical protein
VYQVLAHARCPVLTIRETKATAWDGKLEDVAAFHG